MSTTPGGRQSGESEVSAESLSGRKLAILIGINEYTGGIPGLRNAVPDATRVGEVLHSLHGYKVRYLLDEQATLAGLRGLLSELATEVTAADRLLLYFAGHGIAEEADESGDGPRGFLIPQDARREELGTFLSMTEVQRQLTLLPCRHLLLLLDCCFAGAFRWSHDREVRVRRPTLYRERYERYLRDRAWQVITSAAHDERALDAVAGGILGERGEVEGNSPFAAALCRGLSGAADLRIDGQPGDGVILASELHLFLETAFQRLEAQTRTRAQKPMLWSLKDRDKGQFVFLVPGRQPSLPSALELNERNNPYRGLQLYTESEQSLFFGRAAATDSLCAAVKRQGLTVVVGPSGSGKSSLVRAGLLPRLGRESAPSWRLLPPQRPGASPLAVLSTLAGLLQPGETALERAVSSWRESHPEEQLLLFFDQAEELVTQSAAEAAPFLERLAAVRASGGPNLHVVLTLRADFEPHFKELLTPCDKVSPRFLIPHLSRAELRQVIEGPASERVLYFDPPELVDTLLDETVDVPGALPLLSFTLSEMYRAALKRLRDRTMTTADYLALGGVAGALSQRADELYQSYPAQEDREAFRYLMLRLFVPGEATRRRVLDAELTFSDPAVQRRVRDLCERLLEARLLVADSDGRGQRFVELIHDKLVMGWPQLGRFLAEDRAHMLHRSLIEASQQWENSGGLTPYLWDRDPQLPQALALMRHMPTRLNQLETRFVRRSQGRRRRQQVLAIVAVLSLFAALAGWLKRERDSARQLRQDKVEIERQVAAVNQKLLKSYVDQGYRDLIQDSPLSALLWLHKAAKGGLADGALPTLLAEAMRPVDALQATLVGHRDAVSSIEFSPDGSRVATASQDATARLWDAESGRPLAVLTGHERALRSVVFSADGSLLATSGDDQSAFLWDGKSGRRLAELKGHTDSLNGAAFSHDGRYLVTASADQSARIWETATGRCVRILNGHAAAVNSAVYSPDDSRIATASDDQTARLWDASSGESVATLQGHRARVFSAAFSREGLYVVTASWDHTARIWEVAGARPRAVLSGARGSISFAAFSPDGLRVLTLGDELIARIFAGDTGRQLAALDGHTSSIWAGAFSPDGRRIVTASSDKTARVWDAYSGRPLAVLRGHSSMVKVARFSPDGRSIATASLDGTARIWDARSERAVLVLSGHAKPIASTAFSPDGQRLITQSYDNTIRTWDAQSGRPLSAFESPNRDLRPLTYSPDGRYVVTTDDTGSGQLWEAASRRLLTRLAGQQVTQAAFSTDGRRIVTTGGTRTASVWEASSGRLLAELNGHAALVESATCSPDGRYVVTLSQDHTARIWDADSGRQQTILKGSADGFHLAAFSSDSLRLVTTGWDHTPRVWAVQTGRLIVTLPRQKDTLSAAALAPDGRRVVTASNDGAVRLWDADTGQQAAELSGHFLTINDAVFSADGSRIATAGLDGTVRLWDAERGRLLLSLKGSEFSVAAVAFSPDGQRLAAASVDGIARVFDVHIEHRSSDQLAEQIGCHLAFALEGEGLVPVRPDPTPCLGRSLRPAPTPLWAERHRLLVQATYAWQSGEPARARTLLGRARAQEKILPDPEEPLHIDLAEAIISTGADPTPAAIAPQLGQIAAQVQRLHYHDGPGERAQSFIDLGLLAQDYLYAPSIAAWAFSKALREQDNNFQAYKLSWLASLTSGKYAAMLDSGEQLVPTLPEGLPERAALDCLMWAAAELAGNRIARSAWSQRALRDYSRLADGTQIDWSFQSARYALARLRPRPAAHDVIRAVLNLLEWPKSADSQKELTRLLAEAARAH